MRPAHLLPTLRLFADLARRALAAKPFDHAGQDVAQTLGTPRRLGVVRRHLDERVQARREQEWARAIGGLLERGEHEARALAGAEAVLTVEG